ncbi:MAG: IS630 family transposase, partial [Proteiniphilum sp.]|nr:IS630 family transposase [Proteiniphilum sp.]
KVLDTYKLPHNEDYPVVCMDESPRQLIEDPASVPLRKGQEARVDYEYIRHGMVNIFMANEPLKGKRLVDVTEFKTRKDRAVFVKRISDEMYPQAKKITLVMDNLKTHDPSSLYETFSPEEAKRIWDRFELVYTPKHGSWLNMAEIELHVLNSQCLSRHIASMDEVKKQVCAWQKKRNNKNVKINWQFTNEQARINLKRLYPSVLN